jgi:hypothetical protein
VKARLKHIEDMRIAVADRIQEAESNYVEYYNRKRVEQTHIKVGSLVRLRLDKINFKAFKQRGRKLNPLWYGPFKVIGQPSTVSFKLKLPHDSNLHDTFHVSNLKPATDKTFSKLPQKRISLPAEECDEEEYEVERILDHRWDNKNKTFEYLIQWKDWSSMFENRWEPRAHLDNAAEIRAEYERKVGIDIQDPVPLIQEGESSTKKLKSRKKRRKVA